MKANEIYLIKKSALLLPSAKMGYYNEAHVATFCKNVEDLGFIFSYELFNALKRLSVSQLNDLYKDIIPVLKKMKGAYVRYSPMYPNFPKQVMEASALELYLNAIVHYWSAGTLVPDYKKDERFPLVEKTNLQVIDLGSKDGFYGILTSLLSANTSLSETDKEIINQFVISMNKKVLTLVPDEIPYKENLCFIVGKCLDTFKTQDLQGVFNIKTATDVLRIVTAYSGGDVSLATNTRFKKLSRSKRKFFLSLLENVSSLEEDMVRHKNKWLKLGEFLHPGDYAKMYPRVNIAFSKLRNKERIETFNSKVEESLLFNRINKAINLLKNRPGVFARRLDHIFRNCKSDVQRESAAKQFIAVADQVATPVLLQVVNHFRWRNYIENRVIFPKGSVAKVQVLQNNLPKINDNFCDNFCSKLEKVLVKRFSAQESLGKVYMEEGLSRLIVPFSQRSASKALKTIVRGSRVPLDLGKDASTIRFFIWWKNGHSRTDIDLSAVALDDNFQYITDISYYNLQNGMGCHSGDIVNAPNGASEFIDININKALKQGYRYIAMNVYSFTSQPYCDLPECFAGWMGRRDIQSGEVYEPKTVKNKFDLTSNTQAAVPMIIDLKEKEIIWMDMSLTSRANWYGRNALSNRGSLSYVCNALVNLPKTNVEDLMNLHIKARGKRVDSPEKADTIIDRNFVMDVDKIASEFLK